MKKIIVFILSIIICTPIFSSDNKNSLSTGLGYIDNYMYLFLDTYEISGLSVNISTEKSLLNSKTLYTYGQITLASPKIIYEDLDDLDNITYTTIESFNGQIFSESFLGLQIHLPISEKSYSSIGSGIVMNTLYFVLDNDDIFNINWGIYLGVELSTKVTDNFYINIKINTNQPIYNFCFREDDSKSGYDVNFTGMGTKASLNLIYKFLN